MSTGTVDIIQSPWGENSKTKDYNTLMESMINV